MAATTTGTRESDPSKEVDGRHELVVPLARIMGIAYCVLGFVHAILWIVDPTPLRSINIVTMSALVGVALASAALVKVSRPALAPYFLVGGVVSVVAVAGVVVRSVVGGADSAAPAESMMSVSGNFVVAVVLAGVLLRRHEVLGVAALVAVLFTAQVLTIGGAAGSVAASEWNAMGTAAVAALTVIFVPSLLAQEYSRRLGAALAQAEVRAGEAERHAAELEQARAEIELRVAELASAKKEIERQRELGKELAAEICGMARELAAASSERSTVSAELAAAMAEIVATMEELVRAASQIAANSAQVSEKAAGTSRAAEMGREAVEATIVGFDRIRAHVRSVAEKNLALGQKTHAIGEIIEVITEIADRTHLLALNAAIESAAAGEYGRRFSVVASQVKELANEAKSAAHQVRAAVAEIQRAAGATVLAVERSEADVEAGAELGRRAEDAITQIVDGVQGVAAAAREMLLATQQQRSGGEQVVKSVREMEQVARQTAEGNRLISQAAGRLMVASEQLQSGRW